MSCLLYLSAQLKHSPQLAVILSCIPQEGFLTERPPKGSEEWRQATCARLILCSSLTYFLGYFKNSSPDFINYKGQSLNGHQQSEALAQAQSIGMCDWRDCTSPTNIFAVYLSIFFTQCFNVSSDILIFYVH